LPTFDFATSSRVVFGAGRAAELPALIRDWGARALVCTGGAADRHSGLIDALTMPVVRFAVSGEPTVQLAGDAANIARSQGVDLVIAIGGGSVLDLGKSVAMLLGNGGDPLDYLEVIGQGKPVLAPSVPFAAVPTTAGTGAEVTANAVLSSPEHGRKASLRAASMIPRTAIVDPLLTLGCPKPVTAASGLDALTQCLEPFVSVAANPLSDALARQGLVRAAAGLTAAFHDGADVTARTDMSLCSLLGGMALANSKLGAVHGFAGVIGGLVSAPHGAICAALLASVTRLNVAAMRHREPANPALDRYRQSAALLTGRPAATIEDGIDWIRETVAELQVPGLEALGLGPDSADEIVAKTITASSTKGNPILLTEDELHQALTLSMS
jgi:alcohol dehydrogenase class IV